MLTTHPENRSAVHEDISNSSYLRDGTRTGNTVEGVIVLEFLLVDWDEHPR
jgi:hypothetical protein